MLQHAQAWPPATRPGSSPVPRLPAAGLPHWAELPPLLECVRALQRSHLMTLRIGDNQLPGLLLIVCHEITECRAHRRILPVEGAVPEGFDLRPLPEPHGLGRCKQMRRLGGHRWGELLQRCQVVEDPHRSSVGGYHQRVLLCIERQIVDRGIRQPQPQQIPVRAAIPGDVQSILQPRIVHLRIVQVAPYHVSIDIPGQIAGDRCPRRAVVAGAKQIRLEIATEMPVDGDDRLARIVRRQVRTSSTRADWSKYLAMETVRSQERPYFEVPVRNSGAAFHLRSSRFSMLPELHSDAMRFPS